jgi:uncharacterized protein with ParB-like and HNH nuclease domain
MKELQSLEDIFTKRLFRIPDYQRGYAWGEKQLVEFWEDLLNLDATRSHYTGVLSIKEVPSEITDTWNDEKWLISGKKYKSYFVVDGQQRLTTASIFISCLVDSIQRHTDNIGKDSRDIYLGSYCLDEIIDGYIVSVEPKHKVTKAYKFGYEADNPSFEFLRHHIFNEQSSGTLKETFYTLNLENAKKFFSKNIEERINSSGFDSLAEIFEALTQRFLFNLYEIDDSFDVFVAFETMNNRGKNLSDLELLKNRLIYLTTLYAENEVGPDVKETVRKKINDAWGEVYNQLGRNKNSPLNDDDFLRAHWIMYFKYSRNKGNDYIRYLLDEYFSPKAVLQKVEISTEDIVEIQEVVDQDDQDDQDDEYLEEITTTPAVRSKRTVAEIVSYVDSLKDSAKVWFATFFPQGNNELSEAEQLMMDRVNRVKIGHFRPLIMACLLRTEKGEPQRLAVLSSIERFIFIAFRLCRSQANYRSSAYYRSSRSVYEGEVSVGSIVEDLNRDLEWAFEDDGSFDTSYFESFLKKKFASKGDGFYAWKDIRYFLFEYEEGLKVTRNQPKISWNHFVKHNKDKFSIEHVYPQTPNSDYWVSRFKHLTGEQRDYLKGALGNLLPLSSSINSSLQNDDFPDKKNTKTDASGKVTRNGYRNGSYSELEVAELGKDDEWTPEKIKERGLTLLKFMEKRWQLDMGSNTKKLSLLHLSFLDEEKKPLTENVSS